jgi:hypothetical protein
MTSLANVWEFPEAIPYPGRPRLFSRVKTSGRAGAGENQNIDLPQLRDRLENELTPAL